MWFLETDTLLRIIAACTALIFISVITRTFFKKELASKVMLFADLVVIGSISVPLLIFYALYTLITFLFTRFLNSRKRGKRLWFVILCIVCIIPLLYNRINVFLPDFPILLVFVGISYNMLKAIDGLFFVYYTEENISFFTYANYMLFFPVLTSGPIFRYRDFVKTFNSPQPINAKLIETCIKRLILGSFKKMVALYFVTEVFHKLLNVESHFYVSILIVCLSYVMLYLDLSGYSDIAIAFGSSLGMKVPENFKKPWAAPTFTVFWRNWHVTLSDWIREHIFVVLNGKKLNRLWSSFIGFTTMFVMALWHGFSIAYVISGIYDGLVLGLENLFGLTKFDKRKSPKALYITRCFITNFLFALNTLIFMITPEQIIWVLKGFIKL